MNEQLPSFLIQGEPARLFPVLSTTSKEGRTTSILLACLSKIDELGRELLASAGQRVGSRAKIETFTEIVPEKRSGDSKERPDGLIVMKVGSREWRAFVEAKVGNVVVDPGQVERYRQFAKDNDVHCIITISNQFSNSPTNHPLEAVRKSRSKIPVIHWSWMHILTTADLLIKRNEVQDRDQLILLNELRRFLSHESAGVKGFDRMPKEWVELNQLVASGGAISTRSSEAKVVAEAWQQETRDLALILSRMTETRVDERLPRNHVGDPGARLKDDIQGLCEQRRLQISLAIPDAAAPLDIVVDLGLRSVEVGMTLRAPDDKKTTKARLNWLLRQIKSENVEGLNVRLFWPGRSAQTQHTVAELRADLEVASEGKGAMSPTSFHIFLAKLLGARFAQPVNFVAEIETIVPAFYGEFGSAMTAWRKPAPRLKLGRDDAVDVSTGALADEADTFEP